MSLQNESQIDFPLPISQRNSPGPICRRRFTPLDSPTQLCRKLTSRLRGSGPALVEPEVKATPENIVKRLEGKWREEFVIPPERRRKLRRTAPRSRQP